MTSAAPSENIVCVVPGRRRGGEGLYRPRCVRGLNSAAYLRLQEKTVRVGAAIVQEIETDEWFLDAGEQRALTPLLAAGSVPAKSANSVLARGRLPTKAAREL